MNTNEPIKIYTNDGVIEIDKKYSIPDLGEDYFEKDTLTYIIGLKDMRSKHYVTYDSNIEPAFCVHTPKGINEFSETEEGVYALDMTNKESNDVKSSQVEYFDNMITNRNNFNYYSNRQIKQAEKARDNYDECTVIAQLYRPETCIVHESHSRI